MRILLGYSWGRSPVCMKTLYEEWTSRLRFAGIEVYPFCLTLNPPGERLSWRELDRRWKIGDRQLLSMYEHLAAALESCDVFLNYNGINVHPDFVTRLPTYNVYSCFDDPESSEDLSRPVAAAYDLAMVGNIAEVETYRGWGVSEVRWWPLGFRFSDFDPTLTRQQILDGYRDVNVALLCERRTHFRRQRVDQFALAFPEGAYYGLGWPEGFLDESMRVPLLQRTRVGINIHNSTGPINFRTYYLPANGVLQICDNKANLQKVYVLGKEALGYDTIEEAIDLCRYYLTHDAERRCLAAAGWDRALRDYSEVPCFRRLVDAVGELNGKKKKDSLVRVALDLRGHAERRQRSRRLHLISAPFRWSWIFVSGGVRAVSRRLKVRRKTAWSRILFLLRRARSRPER